MSDYTETSKTAFENKLVVMVYEELSNRLNDRGYKNWLKAGHCLRVLKDGLSPYTEYEIKSFHGDMLNQNTQLRRHCQSSCSLKGNTIMENQVKALNLKGIAVHIGCSTPLHHDWGRNTSYLTPFCKPSLPPLWTKLHSNLNLPSLCHLCSEWQRAILRHHRQPNAAVNWGNCSPGNWRQEPWELAKAYMPRGLVRVKAADQCDASSLLNLINFCDWFSCVDPRVVREVIRCRNELMHSSELRVSDDWMTRYRSALKRLLHQLDHGTLAKAEQQIEEILTVDWSIRVMGVDQMDGADPDVLVAQCGGQWDATAESVSLLEAELLGERLQELLQDTETQDAESLRKLRDFLQTNGDLERRFSAELQAMEGTTR